MYVCMNTNQQKQDKVEHPLGAVGYEGRNREPEKLPTTFWGFLTIIIIWYAVNPIPTTKAPILFYYSNVYYTYNKDWAFK